LYNEYRIMRILGIDYGTKRIGLALSDDSGKIAFPHGVIKNTKSAIVEVLDLIKKENISQVVIGKSMTSGGQENSVEALIKSFGDELSKSVPVAYVDERFTSHEARLREFSKADNLARKIKKVLLSDIDDHAAQIILQRYLDKEGKRKEG
jgi:putative Holliday junction resolvase